MHCQHGATGRALLCGRGFRSAAVAAAVAASTVASSVATSAVATTTLAAAVSPTTLTTVSPLPAALAPAEMRWYG